MRLKLVDNWRKAWKWLSVQFIGLALIWETIPDEVKATMVNETWQGRITFWLLVLAGLGRMVDQGTAVK